MMKHSLLIISFLYAAAMQLSAQDNMRHPKPVFLSKEISRVALGDMYHYQCYATDSANSQLKYQAIDLPGWLTFNTADRTLSGKAAQPGQYLVRLLAINKRDTGQQIFMLTVYDKETINIVCLGNSITNGTDKYNSYRRDLWKLLHHGNYNFDFVGSWNKHHMGGDVPNPDFDMDHDGHSGWTAADIFNPPSWDSIRGNMEEWLKMYTPDIVLIELRTNDVFQCRKAAYVINDFTKLVELLRTKKNDVKIFLAQIPPMGAQWATKKLCGDSVMYQSAILELNSAIALFAKKQTTLISPVVVVDQYSGVNPAVEMYDDIHPNNKGEVLMAQKWFKAIRSYLKKLKSYS